MLDELFTLLGRLAGFAFAAERARNLYATNLLRIPRPDRDCENEAIDLMARYADQRISYTDCISFRLMQQHRSRSVFGFDRHFALPGFELWRP